MATDFAEFIGAAIGFKLLLGVLLLKGAILTGIAAFLILALQQRGQKPLEMMIGGMPLFIAAAYIVELIFSRPEISSLVSGMEVPQLPTSDALPLGCWGGHRYAPYDLPALFIDLAGRRPHPCRMLCCDQNRRGSGGGHCRIRQSGNDGYRCGSVPF